MSKPRIYADFHNADAQGRIRLNCIGTIEDLARQQIQLCEGLALTLYSDDLDDQGQLDELLADAMVCFSEDECCWIARIDWAAIHHASDGHHSRANATSHSSRSAPEEGSKHSA